MSWSLCQKCRLHFIEDHDACPACAILLAEAKEVERIAAREVEDGLCRHVPAREAFEKSKPDPHDRFWCYCSGWVTRDDVARIETYDDARKRVDELEVKVERT